MNSATIRVVCGVNEEGYREVLAIEPLFQKLHERGLQNPQLIISDAYSLLKKAIQESLL